MENVEDKIKSIIDELKPFLISDGGALEYIKFEDGIVYVKLGGACVDCAFLDVTLKDGIEQMIMNEVPEVKEVRNVN
jgi:nifU-like protein